MNQRQKAQRALDAYRQAERRYKAKPIPVNEKEMRTWARRYEEAQSAADKLRWWYAVTHALRIIAATVLTVAAVLGYLWTVWFWACLWMVGAAIRCVITRRGDIGRPFAWAEDIGEAWVEAWVEDLYDWAARR